MLCPLKSGPFIWAYPSETEVHKRMKKSGIFVAVLGVDGSGKSTVIKGVCSELGESGRFHVEVRHLRPNLLPALSRFKTGSRLPRENVGVLNPHASSPAGIVGSTIRICWLWFDYFFGYLFLVLPQIVKTPTVFIFDRYADDLAIDPKRFKIGAGFWLARLVPLLVPRPDLLIALHADAEAIYMRKPELPLEEIRRQVEELRHWASQRPEAVLVSTNGSISEARDAILEAIHQKLDSQK